MPLSFDITNEQKVTGITINPRTGGGNPATIEPGTLAVSILDGNPNASGVIESDGSISVISGNGADGLGTTIFKVSGDADLGAGVTEIADTITLNVSVANASDIGLGGGTVVNK